MPYVELWFTVVFSQQVFTGAVPFGTSPPGVAAMAIMHGNRPPRPPNLANTDKLWGLMQRCWDQKPLLRPKVSEVLRVLPSSTLDKLRRLYEPGVASHEFQLALSRFYCSTEYQGDIDGLHDTDLKEFINFLDTVRPPLCPFCPNPRFDTRFRCYGLRG